MYRELSETDFWQGETHRARSKQVNQGQGATHPRRSEPGSTSTATGRAKPTGITAEPIVRQEFVSIISGQGALS